MNPIYSLAISIYAKSFAKHCKENDKPRMSKLTLPQGIHQEGHFYTEEKDHYKSYFYFYPEDKDPLTLSLIIDIHGGGWVYGDKELNQPFCMTLAKLGFAVLDLSYPLLPKADNLTQIRNLVKGINHAYNHKDEYRIPFGNVTLTGDSAGGMMAPIVYGTSQHPLLKELTDGGILCGIGALVLNHPGGYTDNVASSVGMTGISARFGNKMFRHALYGKWKKNPYYDLVSDFDLLAKNVSFPRTMVITSIKDDILYHGAIRQKETLMKNGVDVTFFEGTKDPATHVFNVAFVDSEAGVECNEAIRDFILHDKNK